MSWDTAAVYYCAQAPNIPAGKTAQLAEPRSPTEFNGMRTVLLAQNPGDVWVGLSDGETEAVWRFASDAIDCTSYLVNNGMWTNNQPDNWNDNGNIDVAEDCAGMAAWSGYHLIDWQCNYKVGWYKLAFCEFRL